MDTAPIALFTYKRLLHAKRTIDALRLNHLAEQSDLVIYSDGPRSAVDGPQVEAVRSYLRELDGFRSVRLVTRERNYGLAQSIITGVTELVERHGRIIVLEDDMVTSRHFLTFMNEALELYADVPEVASIHGYVYPVSTPLPETFFLRGADCWGWATWQRAWKQFEPDGQYLLRKLKSQGLLNDFDGAGAKFVRMLKQQIAGRNDSWAVRWHASVFLQGGLTLYPGISLVRNIGNDATGEHCGNNGVYDVGNVALNNVRVTSIPLREDEKVKAILNRFLRASINTPTRALRSTVSKHTRRFLRSSRAKTAQWREKAGLLVASIAPSLTSSAEYTIIEPNAAPNNTDGWENAAVALKQHQIFLRLLSRMKAGDERLDFSALAAAVRMTNLSDLKVLEIGCGSGWNSEVMRFLSDAAIHYSGIDCSAAMLELARASFPLCQFHRSDALNAPFADRSFNVVVSGTVLMHLPHYHAAIRETVRLSKQWCIFHTIPVLNARPTTFMLKKAYGERTVEIAFNETELLSAFRDAGLAVVSTFPSLEYNLHFVLGERTLTKTYLCKMI